MKLGVISPTFNECENVVPFADAVQKALGHLDYELLIVDDDSPDLTWQRVAEIAARNPRVRVLRRTPPRGLAPSVIDGFLSTNADIIACLDADLQHDPASLPSMLSALENGSEVVIGSRYVSEGKVGSWSRIRRFESWVATKLAKVCLGVEVSDPMSGFFMMRREDFLRIRDRLNAQGFKILLEILVALRPRKVLETPITFHPRRAGESKLNTGIALAYLFQLLRLGLERSRVPARFLKFALVGASGIVVNLLAMAAIVHFSGYADWRSSVLASLVATMNNYVLNNAWTFRDRAHTRSGLVTGYFSYLGMSLIGIAATALSYSSLRILATRMLSLAPASRVPTALILGCQLLSILVGTYLNFTLNRAFTWRKPKQAPPVAPLEFMVPAKKPAQVQPMVPEPATDITMRRQHG